MLNMTMSPKLLSLTKAENQKISFNKEISKISKFRVCSARNEMTLTNNKNCYYLGIDFGTSGARAIVINDDEVEAVRIKVNYPVINEGEYQSEAWKRALNEVIMKIPSDVRSKISCIAIDGTSATTLIVDQNSGKVLAKPELYNDVQNESAVQKAKEMAPVGHAARAPTSSLCKVIKWDMECVWDTLISQSYTPSVLHQADWLSSILHGNFSISDYNNCLKLGYDPEFEYYPHWLSSQRFYKFLPKKVLAPGDLVGPISAEACSKFGLNSNCSVAAGTTDSIAAFIAARVREEGEAVTSLGSTVALKMLGCKKIDDDKYGIYSHRLGDLWLTGGASNSGGAILRKFFSDSELEILSKEIDPEIQTNLNYYPLPEEGVGERFPINDPFMKSRTEPRPKSNSLFLQGLLEGIAEIERMGYLLMEQLGSAKLKRIVTAGGGGVNEKWTQIRKRTLGVPVETALNCEAAYGVALLAKRCKEKQKIPSKIQML